MGTGEHTHGFVSNPSCIWWGGDEMLCLFAVKFLGYNPCSAVTLLYNRRCPFSLHFLFSYSGSRVTTIVI